MLRILGISGKVQPIVAGSGPEIDEYDVVEDLSSWEFVNQSGEYENDRYSFNDEDLDHEDGHGGILTKKDDPYLIGSPSSDVSMESISPPQICSPIVIAPIELNNDHSYNYGYDRNYANSDDEDEDEDDGYDLDDVFVSIWVRDKLGKQRIGKMGKKASPKMNKGKSLPYYYNKPGSIFSKIR